MKATRLDGFVLLPNRRFWIPRTLHYKWSDVQSLTPADIRHNIQVTLREKNGKYVRQCVFRGKKNRFVR